MASTSFSIAQQSVAQDCEATAVTATAAAMADVVGGEGFVAAITTVAAAVVTAANELTVINLAIIIVSFTAKFA